MPLYLSRFLFMALTVLVTPATAVAAITTEERYTYYEITGNNALELRTSINRERAARGKRFDALTRWHIQWQFSFVPRQQKCKITDVTIDASIEYLMPQWPDAAAHPNEQLVAQWQQYYQQLLAHELHHGKLVKAATLEIEQAILRADDTSSAPSNCSKLEKLAEANAHRVMAALEARQQAFDLRTDHGRNTGAAFP